MPSSFASVDTYLATLPSGLESYPDATVKGSVLRAMRTHPACVALATHRGLPPAIARLVADPPTMTSWIPEVPFNVMMAGLYDHAFRDQGGFPAYEAWVCEQNVKLFYAPFYRALFAVVGPQRLLSAVGARWGAFRRGSALSVTRSDATSADLRLVFPHHLEAPTALHAFSAAFRAAMRVARVRASSITFVSDGSSADWHLEWSE